MSDCLFCRIVEGQIPAAITHRDDDVVAFKDVRPQAPFHQLVIPTRHIARLSDASADDAALLGKMMVTGAKLAVDAGQGDDGFRVVMNTGANAGQTVFHIHLHVLAGRPLEWPPG